MKHFSKPFYFLLIFMILVLGVVMIFNYFQTRKYDFKIYFFDAGKADAILLSYRNHFIMIDTGEESLQKEILSYFQSHHITKLDYLIITHFDKDHVGSASYILDTIDVENVFQSNSLKENEYYDKYVASLKKKDIKPKTISSSYSFPIGNLDITVNGPTTIYENHESNNSSLIVSVFYQNTSYLFMGDSENARIKDFLEQDDSTYDFLKIPYHGHYQKRLNDLLESVVPKYAVITSSNNELEDEETLSLLNEKSVSYYLTRRGSITIVSDGEKIIIKQ